MRMIEKASCDMFVRIHCLLFFALIAGMSLAAHGQDQPAESTVDEKLDELASLLKGLGVLDPSAVDTKSLIDSEVLTKAFGGMLERFIAENEKQFDADKIKHLKAAAVPAKMIKLLRCDYPAFLKTTEKQEQAWKNGEFDDRAAKVRVKKSIEILEDFGVALPLLNAWVMSQIENDKLRGSELEVGAQVLGVSLVKLTRALRE
jgi:hypothetical protein